MSEFVKTLRRKVDAGFPLFRLASLEPRRARRELTAYGRAVGVPVVVWTAASGLRCEFPWTDAEADDAGLAVERAAIMTRIHDKGLPAREFVGSPMGAFALAADDDHDRFPGRVLFAFLNAHDALRDSAPARSLLTDLQSTGALNRTVYVGGVATPHVRPIVFVSPDDGLHPDVDHLVEPIELAPLTAAEIREDAIEYLKASLPEGRSGLEGEAGAELADRLATACAGLLQHQVVDVLALAAQVGDADEVAAAKARNEPGAADLARTAGFHPCSLGLVRRYRRDLVNASGIVRVHAGGETFDDVGGLDALKRYAGDLLLERGRDRSRARPKGVLLVGVPGCGKSLFAKAVGNEFARQTLLVDMGALMASDLGGTERNMRRLLGLVDSAGPSVLFADEVEKMLAGTGSSDKTDGGTIARAVGRFMSWSADRGPESDAFVVATANDLAALPPAFYRSGRFNAIFYVGMPSAEAKAVLWRMHRARFDLPDQPLPADVGWTGADVANCCEQAYLLDRPLVEAARFVTRTSKTNAKETEDLEKLAEASGFLDAEFGGEFVRGGAARKRRAAGDGAPRGRRIELGDAGLN